jgi:hypothetical protein
MIISKYYPRFTPVFFFRWSQSSNFDLKTAYPEVYRNFFSPFMNFPRQCLELNHDAFHHIQSNLLDTIGFRRWCITHRNIGFSDFVHRPDFSKYQ